MLELKNYYMMHNFDVKQVNYKSINDSYLFFNTNLPFLTFFINSFLLSLSKKQEDFIFEVTEAIC